MSKRKASVTAMVGNKRQNLTKSRVGFMWSEVSNLSAVRDVLLRSFGEAELIDWLNFLKPSLLVEYPEGDDAVAGMKFVAVSIVLFSRACTGLTAPASGQNASQSRCGCFRRISTVSPILWWGKTSCWACLWSI